ncbi:MAG: YicC family protein [Chlamydiae bacterium]|nr:YicC family protein [Chlamydiota bacterium]MBI3266105.1 YicC family protein [Chlamydiota bacterium]
MIKSMTGYGRAEGQLASGKIVVELSTTNRKYLEVSLNLPKELASFEQSLKDTVGKHVKRGRVQAYVDLQIMPDDVEFVIDTELAHKYVEALRALSDELDLEDDITLKDVLSYKDILSFERTPLNEEEIKRGVCETLTSALHELTQMREREGKVLLEDISKRLSLIQVKVKEVEALAPLALQRYETRVRKKLSELLADREDNEDRVIREVALMAERLDITEEIVRLGSHVSQFYQAFESNNESIGRLLDFLTQEMVREITTVASKSNDLDISRLTVEVRNELDKIREQIQNIE